MRTLRSRRLPLYRVVISLAKAAPDFYLEAAVADAHERDIRPWLVVAIGLRRRLAARPLLLGLLDAEDARSRAAACRALSWLADSRDATALLGMLADADVSVREAAWVALRPYSRRHPVAVGGPVSPSISVAWPDPEPWRPAVAGFEVSG
jgi:HEAT repeat protein